MTTMTTMKKQIAKRLEKASEDPCDGVFMHVCAILPNSTFHDIKNGRWEKCSYRHEFIT